MKKFVFCLLMSWMAGNLAAADPVWLTSLPEAKALAEKEKKLVLLDFTGSDWCPPCKRLAAETLSKPEFAAYATSNLVLVEVDFPDSKPQSPQLKAANKALAEKYNVEVFPTLVALKPDGTVIWQEPGFRGGGPPALIAKLDEAKKK